MYKNKATHGARLTSPKLLAIGATIALVAGCATASNEEETTTAPESPETEALEFDWKSLDGGSVTVLAPQNPWFTAIEPLVPEFEELTGITVDLQALPEAQFRQRRQVVLTGQSSAFDVYLTQPIQDGAQFDLAQWYTDLNPFLNDPLKVSPDYNAADLGPGLMESSSVGGEQIGIPVIVDVEMLYYRKDILSEAGFDAPPTTFEELEQMATAIGESSNINAYASRGKGAAAVTQMSLFLYNYGADWTDESGLAAFDTPEGIAAFEYYGRMIREHGPAGGVSNSWEELMPLFQQGEIALWNDSSAFLNSIINPDSASTEVLENIGYAKMPRGPGGEYNSTLPWSIAISPYASNVDEAWYFIQWATSPDVAAKMQAAGVAQARSSIPFPDTIPAEWADAFAYGLAISRPKLPVVIPVAQVRDVIGVAIVTCIEDEAACSAAVTTAADEFDAIIKVNSPN